MKNLATLFSAELEGIRARTIEVEVDINVGLHAFNIVGLADRSLNEARERVNSALKNSGSKPPNRENRKITVNLAPADVRKTGSQYDLAIALGYLVATKQICNFETRDKIFLGELALDGRLRPVRGALSVAEMAAARGFKTLFLPRANANEASAVTKISVVPLDSLEEVMDILQNKKILGKHSFKTGPAILSHAPDFSDIRGQENAKRALMIAAAGRHNLLMVGPPGVGKSFLARALRGILPKPSLEESIEITKIWSAAGMSPPGLISTRPFRTPHQTSSRVAIVGGGADLRPGEISLAHHGILFLDELPEFSRGTLEALRVPLEAGAISIARAKGGLRFPAKFALVAAMNPCPCGFYGEPERSCRCSAYDILRYRKRISGPLLDRIDIQIKVPRVPLSSLRQSRGLGSDSKSAKASVARALNRQKNRFQSENVRRGLRANADMNTEETERSVRLSVKAEKFLDNLDKTSLSPRGYYRLLRTARTIADLEGMDNTDEAALAEAWGYRVTEDAGSAPT